MNKRILIDKSRSGERTRVAVTVKGELIEYDESSPQAYIRAKNTIYNATVKSIRPELGAAFVQYTESNGENIKDGFLPFSNIAPQYFNKAQEVNSEEEISKLIKVGQKILVQIKKDQLHHESKGAALTTFISLAGTYLVLLPLNQKQGISRKADTEQRDSIRQTLKDIQVDESMGIIIRTAGIAATPQEIEWDYKALLKQWHSIKEAHEKLSAPCLIHEDENIVTRIIRDNMSGNTEKIIVNDKAIYDNIHHYIENVRPEYLEAGVLEFYEHALMFEHYSVEEQVESIFQVRTSLPSGGQIVMHGTEAGYMIDVNSSKSTYGSNVEENALNTNKQAAIKIADMLRLRDVSGIIHIDFIDMNEEANRQTVEKIFNERSSLDRANIKSEPISLLTGCMPVLRQGLGTVFFKSSLESIEHDEAIIIGKRRSVVSYANYMLNVIEKSATQKTDVIQIQLPVDVATYMLNENRDNISAIEKNYQVSVKIIPNENFTHKRYILKRFHSNDQENLQASHEVAINSPDEKSWIHNPKSQRPHVEREFNQSKKPEQEKGSVIASIWNSIFGGSEKDDNKGEKRKGNQRNTRGGRNHRNRNNNSNRNRRYEQKSEQTDTRRQSEQVAHGNAAKETQPETRSEKFVDGNTMDDSQENRTKRTSVNRRRSSSTHNRNRKRSTQTANKPMGTFDD